VLQMIIILSDWVSHPPPPLDEPGRADESDLEVVERDADRVFEIVAEEELFHDCIRRGSRR
jgi:hypothetical protein